jgi:hypothetical protein
MDLLTVALDLHCYACGRDVHLEYEPLTPEAAPAPTRPVNARFSCPHCTHENEIDLPGAIVVTRKPPPMAWSR